MSERERAAAAIIQDSINNPPTHTIHKPVIYNVNKVAASTNWIRFDTVNRMGVKFNTGHTELGTNVIEVAFKYRFYGAPNGNIRVGIRKALDDSFLLIAEWPVEFNPTTIGVQQTALIIGANPYFIVAGDLISIEFGPSLGVGGELIAPHERRNTDGSALAVLYGKDVVGEIGRRLMKDTPGIVTLNSRVITQVAYQVVMVKCIRTHPYSKVSQQIKIAMLYPENSRW